MSEPDSQHPDDVDGQSERDVHALHDPIMREKERPRDGYQPIPLTLIFLFFGLIGWGGWYLGEFSGDWRVDVLYPGDGARAVKQKTKSDEKLTPDQLRDKGQQVYARCASCHQRDGKGTGSFPPLDGSSWVTGSKQVPIRIVLHGLEGPITVSGTEYNQQMPAWGDRMDDTEIAAVLTFVRSSWSNQASPVTPGEVREVRDATSDRSSSWSASDLNEFRQ